MKITLIGCALFVHGWIFALQGAELKPETLSAWQVHVSLVEAKMKHRAAVGPFLWLDEQQPGLKDAVTHGEVRVAPMIEHGVEAVPNGLIHHWVGAAFIPNTGLDEVVRVTRDYSRYKEFFNPEVADSRSLSKSSENDRFTVRWATKVLFVRAGIDTECLSKNVRVDDAKFYQTSVTTRVQEIQNYGKSSERQLAPDQGDGFIWRLYTITRYEARNGGVYLEVEALALTRDIPGSVRMFVAPIVRNLSYNSLLLSLRQTRDAVLSSRGTGVLAHSSSSLRLAELLKGN